ncbi:hypothetical protein [Myxococcus xanthus]|uniref:hypothetical protein n=1 Tax=Myxococcus xanthus TaxID=34 RepID=UPI001127EC0E|nr:hypothetical protein [Myxococcus xanthus]QDF05398.1 hypothetical protein BHS04_19655 [Myxococcus xanthus]
MAQGGTRPSSVDAPEQVPGLLKLLLLLLFRPVDLHFRLRAAGIRVPGARLGTLCREQPEGDRATAVYVRRMLLVLLVGAPVVTQVLGLALVTAGLPLERGWVLSALFCSAVGLVVAQVLGLAAGVLLGSLASLATLLGLHATAADAFGPELGGVAGMVVGMCLGGVAGLACGSISGIAIGRGPTVVRVQLAAILASLTPMLLWSGTTNASYAGAVAASALVAFLVSAFRLPLYALEVLASAVAYAVERWTGRPTLGWVPVRHHNLSYLPHPFLGRHLALAVRSRPAEVLAVADACLRSPGNIVVGWPWVVQALESASPEGAGEPRA